MKKKLLIKIIVQRTQGDTLREGPERAAQGLDGHLPLRQVAGTRKPGAHGPVKTSGPGLQTRGAVPRWDLNPEPGEWRDRTGRWLESEDSVGKTYPATRSKFFASPGAHHPSQHSVPASPA